ncbi:autotransporter assembly complex protein TamA [Ramlibacter sp. MAHUQ-53]|uniref:autotransporter assembly complex protein TamA n=1 Tax=unclassified Ramlibacter TaxID=2617605 RepID=UPI003637280C
MPRPVRHRFHCLARLARLARLAGFAGRAGLSGLSGLVLAAALAAGEARAQAGAPAPVPAFTLEISAPAPVRELLARHLALGRYREVSDLDEAELARLLVLAEREARELLATQGYFAPSLSLATDAAARPPRVTIRVEPGEATRVEAVAIAFEGDIAATIEPGAVAQREDLRAGWRLRPGERFTQEAWDEAKAQATRALTARRYLRARIAHGEADVDAAASRARLGLRLDSGPRFSLGPLQVTGLERYDPRIVPRLARLREGADYDQDELVQAQLRLAGSGYFDSAFLYVDPDSDPRAAPVQVQLREAPMQRVVLGLGLTTDRGPRLSLEHRHNRVPGLGWRAATRVQLERRARSAETEWTDIPDAAGWRWGVLARAERQEDDTQVTLAQRLRVGRSEAGDRIERNVFAQFDRATVHDIAGIVDQEAGDGTALTAGLAWTGRWFDQRVQPTRGFGVGLELGGGVTLAGRNIPFQRTVARGLWLLPLPTGRLQLRAEGGAVLTRGDARVPSTQLFRTGGDTTVRGYGYRDIGVERAGGTVSAGRYLAVGSVEWQRPVRRDGEATPWEHTLFLDAGSVGDRAGRLADLAYGLGTGVRYASPVGPLRADIAWASRTRRPRLHLSVGVVF